VTLLRLQGVCKRLGKTTVLNGLSLDLEPGDIYGLLGPNGSGKSTALNIVSGLMVPDAGEVSISGRAPGRATAGSLGFCAQQPALYRDLRPAENLDFHARVHGLHHPMRGRRVTEAIELFGLAPCAERTVGELSGGWQQRVHLACAVVHRPELLILDEPTSAVDLEARHELWGLIQRLQSDGMSILLTTHHLEEAERLCSRIGILKGGRLVAEGTLRQLLAQVPAQAVALLRGGDESALCQRARDLGWPTRTIAGQMACLLPTAAKLREVVDAFAGLDVQSVTLQPVGLEHAYLEAMQKG
jgi:ABC-2 type transport system ATP-binding protein